MMSINDLFGKMYDIYILDKYNMPDLNKKKLIFRIFIWIFTTIISKLDKTNIW